MSMRGMRFTFLTGDMNWKQYGGKFVSAKQNNGEFDYWLVMEVINWDDATGETRDGLYNVSLYSVSPSEAGKDNLEKAFRCSMPQSEDAKIRSNPLVQVECLCDYGIKAQLWSENGNNLRKLMRQCREQAAIASGLYGFYMDRAENRIGSTGWELQRGDIDTALNRLSMKG
jgi:hypothetical protein